jgi:hypothetical protein
MAERHYIIFCIPAQDQGTWVRTPHNVGLHRTAGFAIAGEPFGRFKLFAELIALHLDARESLRASDARSGGRPSSASPTPCGNGGALRPRQNEKRLGISTAISRARLELK